MFKFLFDFAVTTPSMVMRWLFLNRHQRFMQFLEKDYGPMLMDYFVGIVFWLAIWGFFYFDIAEKFLTYLK
ncbi:MAG: hypothetical protein JNM93_00765 [Bacteriovoracaceae bacterium]|nr:hypothetical protein [Bacteriovoracaceae bacterium]